MKCILIVSETSDLHQEQDASFDSLFSKCYTSPRHYGAIGLLSVTINHTASHRGIRRSPAERTSRSHVDSSMDMISISGIKVGNKKPCILSSLMKNAWNKYGPGNSIYSM